MKVADLAFTVGGLASSTKGVVDLCTGAAAGGTLVPSLEALGQILGERANRTIMKLLAQTSGQVLSGSVTLVFGGVTMLWDMYNLKSGVRQLADGSQEGALIIREIADQLEVALTQMTEHQERTSQT